ncbi:uncharacterized protein LOC8028338 isoform X1 [Ixodes scapularis]|uniref:uncharacterized protein LOC8028338 isoform X1 n=1 Tax=Ixodes scapularis TaxID=6945 RepID=UPI001A9DA951|nr:uncharacterized protein LOC8028338 isoform X1 [Ixodes scapularis]
MESRFSEYNSSLSACEGPSLVPLSGAESEQVEPSGEALPHCERSTDAQGDCWQQLEAFWGAEKHRCQHELLLHGSSTENQLQCRDYLSEPPRTALLPQGLARNAIKPAQSDFLYIVRGEDVNDVPTSYVVNGLRPHEFPVIGTYVDKRVVPGFRYRVRVNRTSRQLFDGRALTLESVGRGYGKRITFEAPPGGLNDNDNYFYSDTIAQGYGFSPVALEVGDRFRIRDSDSEEPCGDLLVAELLRDQTELGTDVLQDGTVEKQIRVSFHAKFLSVSNRLLDRQLTWNRVKVNAVAFLVKPRKAQQATLERLVLEDCALAGYELVSFSRRTEAEE